jgi:hypothetical protein
MKGYLILKSQTKPIKIFKLNCYNSAFWHMWKPGNQCELVANNTILLTTGQGQSSVLGRERGVGAPFNDY